MLYWKLGNRFLLTLFVSDCIFISFCMSTYAGEYIKLDRNKLGSNKEFVDKFLHDRITEEEILGQRIKEMGWQSATDLLGFGIIMCE